MTQAKTRLFVCLALFLLTLAKQGNSTGGFELTYIEEYRIYTLLSLSGNAALVHDCNASIAALYNGQSAIIFDINSLTVSRVNSSKLVWLSSNESFADYLGSLSSLQNLLEAGKQTAQNIKTLNADESALKYINDLLLQIGDKETPTKKLDHIYVKLKQSEVYLKGSLCGLFKGNGSFRTREGIKWITKVIHGVGSLLEYVPGGAKELIKNGVKFNVTEIFNAAGGVDVVSIIFEEIGQHTNLAQLLGNIVSSFQHGISKGLSALLGGSEGTSDERSNDA